MITYVIYICVKLVSKLTKAAKDRTYYKNQLPQNGQYDR